MAVLLILSAETTTSSAQEVAVAEALAYGNHPQQSLDLSIPAVKGFSTVLFVHGGSLHSGDKADTDYRNVCLPFVRIGIGCANMNYRLAPMHPWPAQAEDVAAAVACLRKNIPARGGDPDRIILVGHSSGGLLAALVGSDEHYLAARGLTRRNLSAVVSMGSIMWDVDIEKAIENHGLTKVDSLFSRSADAHLFGTLSAYLDHWPIRHVRAGMPPFLFLIAESEQEHPPVLMTNRTFAEKSRSLGNRAEFKVLPDRTHYSAIRKLHEPGDAAFIAIRDFIAKASH